MPEELSTRSNSIKRINSCFEDNGFSQITTPTFEHYEALAVGWDAYLKTNSIQFFSDEGVHMVLRPEMTTPIARLVSSRKAQLPLPLKLYYVENVFRKNHILRKNEFMQIGMEYLGVDGVKIDAQVIKVLIEVLTTIGIKNFKIEVGHTENIKCLSEDDIDNLKKGFLHKLKVVPQQGNKTILRKGGELESFSTAICELDKDADKHLIYNMGLVEDIDYYTGIIFRVLLEGVGYVAGSGGRYNGLLKKYGRDIPAVGFALEFEKLAMAMGETNPSC